MDNGLDFLLYGNQFKKLYEKEISVIREKYDLKKIDIDILYCIYHLGDNNTSKGIKELNSSFNKGHISQSVDHLQNRKFIVAVHDEADRRCIHLKLTEEAVSVVHEIEVIHEKLHNIIFEGITKEEQALISRLAERIKVNVEAAI